MLPLKEYYSAQNKLSEIEGDGSVEDDANSQDYDGDGVIEEMEEAGAYQIEDWFSWYDWDFRVDAEGDIHAIMSVVPQSLEFVHHLENASGFYYLTCDKEDIANPGEVIELFVTLENLIPWNDAENADVILSTNDESISIINEYLSFNNLNVSLIVSFPLSSSEPIFNNATFGISSG